MKFQLILLGFVLFLGCGNQGNYAVDTAPGENYKSFDAAESGETFPAGTDASQASGSEVNLAQSEKKIIKSGHLEMEVKKMASARQALDTLVKKLGAEISLENQRNEYWRLETHLTIRLAPEQFDLLVSGVEAIGINTVQKSIQSEDVTQTFIDLETRLQAKRDVIARYREILKGANKVTDVLAVEEKLRLVIEEVESIEAQLKYLKNRVQYSTLEVTLFQNLEKPEADKRSFLDKLGKSFANGWNVFLELILGLISVWPLTLLGIGFFWWLYRVIRKRMRT